jgi:hypothetical protein
MALQQFEDLGRIAHATIVSAPDREASLACAEQLAAALVCQGSGPRPCGVCRACRKAAAGIHPDIVRVKRPEDDKGRPKKEIQVDQIRWVVADALVLPNESERKVYLIEDADSMNTAAQNAALKLLEEPPRGVYFLLCVSNGSLLLPTVRSRCALWSPAAGEQEQDPALRKLAEDFLRLCAEGDRAALLRWCVSNEDMDNRGVTAFLDCAAACTAERITGRAAAGGLGLQELLRLHALLERCRLWARVNTGARHLFGLLAVDAIADEEIRGVSH